MPARRHPRRGRPGPPGPRAAWRLGCAAGGLRMRLLPVGQDALLVDLARRREAQALHAELLRRTRRARCAGAGDRAGRQDRAALRPARLHRARRRTAAAGPRRRRREQASWWRYPCGTTAPTWAWSPRRGACAEQEVVRSHAGTELRVAFSGFAPGFGYLTGPREPLRRAAPGSAAHRGAGRVGGPGRPLHGHLPALLTGRLAVDRHHGRRCPVGPARAPAALLVAGDPGAFRASPRGVVA